MSHKVYTYPNNPRVWKAQIAGKFNALEIEEPAFQIGVDNKTPEFAAKFPAQKVPALETPEGPLFESNAMARYAARYGGDKHKLYGATTYEAALIDQWIDFSANEIDLPAAAWLYPIYEIVPFNAEATERAKADIKKALELLNKHLTYRTYLVGERVSLADIVVSLSLHRLYTMVFDSSIRKAAGNVNRWFLTCVNQPQWRSVIGETKFAETMAVAKGAAAAAAAKKAEPAAAKKAESSADAAGSEEEAKPKAKSKLDLLPPTSLDLDEWKRTYSNNPILTVAMPWFWEHLDAAGWSVWKSEYKYDNELTKMFMTSNLVGGFLQRMDRLRKYAFGSMLIFGEEPKLSIAGVWLFRGTELPEELWENPDAEHHTWTKLDLGDAAQRKVVETYWSWEGDFGDKVFQDNGKIFK